MKQEAYVFDLLAPHSLTHGCSEGLTFRIWTLFSGFVNKDDAFSTFRSLRRSVLDSTHFFTVSHGGHLHI